MTTWTVYGLTDPNTGEVRYVGVPIGFHRGYRPRNHYRPCRACKKRMQQLLEPAMLGPISVEGEQQS